MLMPKPLVCLILVMTIGTLTACRGIAQEQEGKTRPSCCAGSWYPGDAAELTQYVDEVIAKAPALKNDEKPLAIIVPHAGYRFSAAVAATAYRALQGRQYKRVILLGFGHRYASGYKGIVLPVEWSAYETPLGTVPLDRPLMIKLRQKDLFLAREGVDRDEHSLELQLPFLQRTLKEFKLAPMLVGRMSDQDYAAAG